MSEQPHGRHASDKPAPSPGQAPDERRTGFWRSRIGVGTIVFLAIGGFFLVTEHRAHLIPYLGYLPVLLVLACLPMHFFMHGGHGDHRRAGDTSDGASDGTPNTPPRHH